jgi:Ca2+-transporting ATPase
MNTPPRDLKEHIMNRLTASEVILLGSFIGGLAFVNFGLYMLREGVIFTVDSADPVMYARATTITYLTIAYCQFANILSHRYEYTSLFSRTFWTNRLLLASILVSIGLMFLAVYGPHIRNFLRFAALSLTDWLYVLGAAGAYLIVFELLKAFKRSKGGKIEVGRPRSA